MKEGYYITVGDEKVAVSEEVYRAFKRPAWVEHKRRQVRAEHERSLESLMDDGVDIPSKQAPVDELVETKLLLDMLLAAMAELTDEERALIDALFIDGKSEREVALETSTPQKTISNHKKAVLKKLKNFFE
jgi:RNA polymerase sigma factor (sigma-70 family)